MSKQIALLEFSVMFDPAETWAHMYEFEASFANFLKFIGLEAEVMMPVGMGTKRVLFIRKIEEVSPLVVENTQTNEGPQEKLKEMKKGLK